MGAEARKYLHEHSIPQLFESLMTGIIYCKPKNPLDFLEDALSQIRKNPELGQRWDAFIDTSHAPALYQPVQTHNKPRKKSKAKKEAAVNAIVEEEPGGSNSATQNGRASKTGSNPKSRASNKSPSPAVSERSRKSSNEEMIVGRSRSTSVSKAAAVAQINPDAPIVLFMGGPGGGKSRHAVKIRDEFESQGLVHICVPDLIKDAIARYKDRFPEWKEAARRYERGELISNNLAQDLVKSEMGRFPNARAYFLEGFPREARQVEDFEQHVRTVNMAMILDYDEDTLRKHMQSRGLDMEVIDRRINEFRQKTLPSAKYFDDHRLLHLIPGEKDDNTIFERMRKLVGRAIETGVPVLKTPDISRSQTPDKDESAQESSRVADESNAEEEETENVYESSRVNGNATPTSSHKRSTSKTPSSAQRNAIETNEPEQFRSTPRENLMRSIGATESAKSRQTPQQILSEQSRHSTANGNIRSQIGTQDNQRQSTAARQSASPSSNKPQTAGQSRPMTVDEMNGQRSVNNSQPASAQQRFKRTDSQASGASKKSEPESRHSSVGRQTPTQQTNSKPPTAGSRPESGNLKQSSAVASRQASAVGTPKSVAQQFANDRPPSSVASTPKPTSGFNDQLNSDRMASSNTSRIPTAADRFPKGLPNNAPVILVIGAPGSNKAEIANRIAHKYEGFVHLSMGDLLRKKVQQNLGDELWSRVGKKIEVGESIPQKICRDILYSTIHDIGSHSWGYVIQGYPRTLAQAEDIESQLGRLDVALLIDCTEAFCKENIRKRFEESKDKGGNERPDDNESSAKQRLALFKQNTLPMLKHLDDKGKLRVVRFDDSQQIEGDSGVEKLYQDVIKLLDNTLFIKDEQNANGNENIAANQPETKNGI